MNKTATILRPAMLISTALLLLAGVHRYLGYEGGGDQEHRLLYEADDDRQCLEDEICRFILGLILLVCTPIIICWNEHQYARISELYSVAKRSVHDLQNPQKIPAAKTDGKFVCFGGMLEGETTLVDALFPWIKVDSALLLVRDIEIYQYVQVKKGEDYKLEQRWCKSPQIDPSRFKDKKNTNGNWELFSNSDRKVDTGRTLGNEPILFGDNLVVFRSPNPNIGVFSLPPALMNEAFLGERHVHRLGELELIRCSQGKWESLDLSYLPNIPMQCDAQQTRQQQNTEHMPSEVTTHAGYGRGPLLRTAWAEHHEEIMVTGTSEGGQGPDNSAAVEVDARRSIFSEDIMKKRIYMHGTHSNETIESSSLMEQSTLNQGNQIQAPYCIKHGSFIYDGDIDKIGTIRFKWRYVKRQKMTVAAEAVAPGRRCAGGYGTIGRNVAEPGAMKGMIKDDVCSCFEEEGLLTKQDLFEPQNEENWTVTPYSVSAQQWFLPYGEKFFGLLWMYAPGVISSKQLFARAARANARCAWKVRGITYILLFAGWCLVFEPLTVAFRGTFFRSLLSLTFASFAFVLGSTCWTTCTAAACFTARPINSILIIATIWIVFAELLNKLDEGELPKSLPGAA